MANFNTHLSVAFYASSGTAIFAASTQLVSWFESPWFIFMGTIGGLLPDIDSDHSKSARLIFLLLSIVSILIMLSMFPVFSILHTLPIKDIMCHKQIYNPFSALTESCVPYSLPLVAIGLFFTVRYPLFSLFKKMTVHRGVFHSILAASFFSLSVVCLTYYFLKQEAIFAWLSGFFIGIGFMVHLLLDEMYSVDLSNRRLKRSFGTALKLCSYRSWFASLSLLLCTVLLYFVTPSALSFVGMFRNIFNQ